MSDDVVKRVGATATMLHQMRVRRQSPKTVVVQQGHQIAGTVKKPQSVATHLPLTDGT
jgi:hypothetical protein